MKKILFTLCCISIVLNSAAQDYEKSRNLVIKNILNSKFAEANSRLNLLKVGVPDSIYNCLRRQLNDSIGNTYKRANVLKDSKKYQNAIYEYKKLFDRQGKRLNQEQSLYAYIGYCYEMSGYTILAKNWYKKGIDNKDRLAHKYMNLIGQNQEKTCSDKFLDFMSDLVYAFTPEDETWGISSSYSKQFPITIAANRTWSVFSLGCEIGVDLKGDRYINEQYNPLCYITLSPGAYFKYISINCGIGSLLSSYKKGSTLINGDSYTGSFEGVSDDGSISVNGSVTITQGDITISHSQIRKIKWDFVFKPSITGYIPICDEDYYITINAGYNYIPKIKKLNGWSFGLGFQWVIW